MIALEDLVLQREQLLRERKTSFTIAQQCSHFLFVFVFSVDLCFASVRFAPFLSFP